MYLCIKVHFVFSFLLKNMFFVIHCLLQQITRHINRLSVQTIFSKKNSCVMGVARKSRTSLSQGSPCGEKKPPGRMRGISFVSQTGWWRRGESNSRRRRFHALSQKPRKSLKRCQSPLAGGSGSSLTTAFSFSSSRTF